MLIGSTPLHSNLYSLPSVQAGGVLPVSKLNSISSESVNVSSNASQNLDSQASRPISYSPSLIQNKTSPQSSQESNNSTNNSTSADTNTTADKNQQAMAEAEVDQVIRQLKARDTEVRAHEMAHLAVAGQYAKGMSFSYQTGPDGKQYAIGGEVGIDTSPVSGDPQATIEKALLIQRAAMAPAEPSAQDRKVAQQAGQMLASARVELMAQQRQESQEVISTEDKEPEMSGISDSVTNDEASSAKSIAPSMEINSGLMGFVNNFERNQFDLRQQIAR